MGCIKTRYAKLAQRIHNNFSRYSHSSSTTEPYNRTLYKVGLLRHSLAQVCKMFNDSHSSSHCLNRPVLRSSSHSNNSKHKRLYLLCVLLRPRWGRQISNRARRSKPTTKI